MNQKPQKYKSLSRVMETEKFYFVQHVHVSSTTHVVHMYMYLNFSCQNCLVVFISTAVAEVSIVSLLLIFAAVAAFFHVAVVLLYFSFLLVFCETKSVGGFLRLLPSFRLWLPTSSSTSPSSSASPSASPSASASSTTVSTTTVVD